MESEAESRRRGSGAPRARRRPRVPAQLKRDLGFALLIAALLVAGLGFGAQHVPVLLLAVLLALAAAVAAPKDVCVPRLTWVLLALAGYSALQATPLPIGVVRFLSPESALVWEGALRPLREAPLGWASLSVDPSGTWLETLKFSGYACVVVAAAGVRARHGSRPILAMVFLLALLICLVTLAHGLVRAPKIYGLYPPPIFDDRWTRGPFVNGNNLAGYLNLGLFAATGFWLGGRSPLPSLLLAAGVPLLATGLVLSGSRGGVLAAALGGTALVVHGLVRRSAAAPRLIVGSGLTLVLAVAALFALGDSRLHGSLFDTSNQGKILGFRGALALIHDNAWFGVGRGAFDGAFQPYRGVRGDASTIFVHAENLVLDWVSEWGAPVGLVALLACGYFVFRLGVRAGRDPTLVGAVVAVGAVLLQSQVDFGLEVFGLAAPFWVLLSLGESGHEREQSDRARWYRVIPVAGAAVAALVVVVTEARPLQTERRDMRARFAAFGGGDRAAVKKLEAELRDAILRHPGDGYLPLLGARVAQRLEQNPLRWLGRALERNPTSGYANLALAEALGAAGQRSQALIHLRLAGAYDFSLSDRSRDLAVALESNVDALSRAFPRDAIGGGGFVALCAKLPVPSRIPCFREAARRDASSQTAQEGLATELLEALSAGREPCAGPTAPRCVAEAKGSAASLKAESGFRRVMLKGRLRALDGDVAGAVRSLLGECPATQGALRCLELAVDLAIGRADPSLVGQAVERYLAIGCEDSERCAATHRHVAERFERGGDLRGALEHHTAAARQAPSAAAWLKVADLRARAGSVASVHAALEEARAFGPLDEQQRREIARLEQSGNTR